MLSQVVIARSSTARIVATLALENSARRETGPMTDARDTTEIEGDPSSRRRAADRQSVVPLRMHRSEVRVFPCCDGFWLPPKEGLQRRPQTDPDRPARVFRSGLGKELTCE